jgi:hypothetical protein
MKRALLGAACAGLLGAAGMAPGWEVASYTPSAVAPQLPAPAQAVALSSGQRAPLWWLRRPHREAVALGWLGVPPRAPAGRASSTNLRTQDAAPVRDDWSGGIP